VDPSVAGTTHRSLNDLKRRPARDPVWSHRTGQHLDTILHGRDHPVRRGPVHQVATHVGQWPQVFSGTFTPIYRANRLHEDFGAGQANLRQVRPPVPPTGSFLLPYGKAWRTIAKLSLPGPLSCATTADGTLQRPASERMFSEARKPGFSPGRT